MGWCGILSPMTTHPEAQPEPPPERTTRRRSLVKLGGAVAAALGAGAWEASSEADAAGNGPAAVAAGLVTCVLTPEQTEGPYYIDGAKLRRDVREGRPGAPLTLRTTVLDVSTCKPVQGASVEIWHCDAEGVYSGVDQQQTVGEMFLRGVQKTDAKGVATFVTIFPGWYPGRTVHIHTMVHLGGNVVHTGQLYFTEKATRAIYANAPYRRRAAARETTNANDSIYRNGGSKSVVRMSRRASGAYTGTITMGVARS